MCLLKKKGKERKGEGKRKERGKRKEKSQFGYDLCVLTSRRIWNGLPSGKCHLSCSFLLQWKKRKAPAVVGGGGNGAMLDTEGFVWAHISDPGLRSHP